jgi:hypothetical protein
LLDLGTAVPGRPGGEGQQVRDPSGTKGLAGGGSRLGHQLLGSAGESRADPPAVPRSTREDHFRRRLKAPPSGSGRGPGTYVVSVAVGAVETHSAEGVARNGSRHDANLQLSHHAPRRAHSLPAGSPLSILGNGVCS